MRRAARAPRPGRGRRSRAAPASASSPRGPGAARARRRAAGPRRGCRWAAAGPCGSPRRDTCRTTSWFDSTQVVRSADRRRPPRGSRRSSRRAARRVPRRVEVLEVERLVHLVGADVPQRAARSAAPTPRRRARVGRRTRRGPAPVPVDLVHAVLVPHRVPRRVRIHALVDGVEQPQRTVPVGQRPRSLTRPCATSTRNPSTPRSSQNRRMSRNSARTCGLPQFQVGLLGVEEVQVPLTGLPSASTTRLHALPPNTDGQLFGGCSPSVPCRRGRCSGPAPADPGAAASAARNQACSSEVWFGHQVDDHLEAQLVGSREQRVGVGEAAEDGVDVPVVGDVVPRVGLRGAVERRQPHGVDAELAQVGQPGGDAGQVADAVAVGVGRTSGGTPGRSRRCATSRWRRRGARSGQGRGRGGTKASHRQA